MQNVLHFNQQNKLKIVQFTDVHWVDGGESDQKTLALMRMILHEEKPDFVAITGDLIYGERNKSDLRLALAPVLEANIPWAYVFGNHDTEWGHSREELCLEAKTLPNCMMERGDTGIAGVGNYVIRVNDAQGHTRWALYFLDSNDYNADEQVGGYGYIQRSQIDWYVNAAQSLKQEVGEHSALSFFHIPLPEYNDVWDYHPCYGQKEEGICCPRQNSGMFSAMLEMGNMRGVFVGHDHINDFDGNLYGTRLCYGRATGYNTYGKKGFRHGARIIELDAAQEATFSSWLRLDDHSVVVQNVAHKPSKQRDDD